MKKAVFLSGMLSLFLCITPIVSFASMIYGTPVAPDGTSVTGDVVGNEIFYYIPLKEETSGDYDVKGSTPDIATAPTSGWLNMYIKFDGIDPAVTHADIKFNFVDLDLDPDNDPYALHESVQFFLWDEVTLTGDALTGVVKDADNNPDPGVISISGDNDSRDIVFADFDLSTSDDDLIFKLLFKSDLIGDKTWQNTKESVTALLNEGAKPVPEPATLLLLGGGLVGLAGIRRKIKK